MDSGECKPPVSRIQTARRDAAIQAVSDQPWDASVKSLVAFPQLMALMGENPQWVQNLGDAFPVSYTHLR